MSIKRMGVIAIGSNSVRMLTANLDAALSQPVRGREETALFLSLDDKKRFSEAGMDRTARAVSKLHYEARQAGAQEIRLIATSAMRDAHNRTELDFYIAALAPILVNRIISGDEEAQLSFLGACCVPPQEGLQGMIDIGGGSTEVAVGDCLHGLRYARSMQLGASRLLQRQPVDGEQGLAAARAIARQVVTDGLREGVPAPRGWTLVGGTGNTLANMMVKRPYDKLAPEDHPLTLEDVQGWLTRLATMTPEERARLAGMPPTRVHILPTGLVILREVMAQLGIGQLRVTQRTNLDGYLYRLVAMPQEDHDA